MQLLKAPLSLLALLAAGLELVQGQYMINDLSFGYSGKVKDGKTNEIPNFTLQGQPNPPSVLSNKLILTPVAPGNYRGALWAQKPLNHETWAADVDFRASGPERGGGNLQIWLDRNGGDAIGSSSIYTVGKFDGLALVVDAHGGSGGMLRGFLNDGTVDYSQHHNVDELAFGHCKYAYRNLGRPSQIKLRQTRNSFKVEVDTRLCFETDKVFLPSGNYFGITAATPETPDSIEIFKMVVMSENAGTANSGGSRDPPPPPPQRQPSRQQPISTGPIDDEFDDFIPDEDADVFQTSKQQFQDLHNRLQASTHQLSAMFRTTNKHSQMDEKRHGEIKDLFADMKTEMDSRAQVIEELQKKVVNLEKEVKGMRGDISRKMTANEKNIKGYLGDHHATLSQTLIDSMPGHKRLILVIVGTQVVLVGAYVLYKKRKSAGPKKYL